MIGAFRGQLGRRELGRGLHVESTSTQTEPLGVDGERRHRGSFAVGLGLIVVAGIGIRLAYALAGGGKSSPDDGIYYHLAAKALVDGGGFINPWSGAPTAVHPPAWPAVLALPSVIGLDTVLAHQLVACAIGATSVVLVGVAGREIAGARVGWIAAAIAAAYPNMWVRERELAAETLVFPLVAIVLILAYRFWTEPRTITFAALGGTCGVLALVRAEQALILVLLLPPLVLRARPVPSVRRVAQLAAGTGVAALVLLPWVAHNTTRFERPVLLTTGFGVTARGGNCPAAYYGAHIGSQDPDIWLPAGSVGPGRCAWDVAGIDESEQDAAFRDKALTYVHDHVERLPVVIAAREGRTWGLLHPFQEVAFAQVWGNAPNGAYRVGLFVYWLLLPLAVLGGVRLHDQRIPLVPLLSFVVLVALAVAITYGNVRFRAAAEVPIVLLAAVGVDAVWRRLRPHGRPAAKNSCTTSTQCETHDDSGTGLLSSPGRFGQGAETGCTGPTR